MADTDCPSQSQNTPPLSHEPASISHFQASIRLPGTPPQVQCAMQALGKMSSLIKSIRKSPPSPTKSCSPTKVYFLTKDSNLTNFTGWDVDGRLSEFESQFEKMKEAFEGTMKDRKTLEDAIDLAKARST